MVQKVRFTIRTACREDAVVIYAIHKLSLTTLCVTHYPPDILQRWFVGKTVEGYYRAIDCGDIFVCECLEEVAGFGHAIPGEVVAIFVHPDFAGRGVGTSLLTYAISRAWIGYSGPIKVISTLNAQRFYEKHGFTEVQRYSISRGDIVFPVVEMTLPALQHI